VKEIHLTHQANGQKEVTSMLLLTGGKIPLYNYMS